MSHRSGFPGVWCWIVTACRASVPSDNRLTGPDPALRTAFSRLEILMANRQQYTWEEVLQCAPMWPDLHRITVSDTFSRQTQLKEWIVAYCCLQALTVA